MQLYKIVIQCWALVWGRWEWSLNWVWSLIRFFNEILVVLTWWMHNGQWTLTISGAVSLNKELINCYSFSFGQFLTDSVLQTWLRYVYRPCKYFLLLMVTGFVTSAFVTVLIFMVSSPSFPLVLIQTTLKEFRRKACLAWEGHRLWRSATGTVTELSFLVLNLQLQYHLW